MSQRYIAKHSTDEQLNDNHYKALRCLHFLLFAHTLEVHVISGNTGGPIGYCTHPAGYGSGQVRPPRRSQIMLSSVLHRQLETES